MLEKPILFDDLALPSRVPKMLTPFATDGFTVWGLNGVVGVPNSGRDRTVFEKFERYGEAFPGGNELRLDGVSGIA